MKKARPAKPEADLVKQETKLSKVFEKKADTANERVYQEVLSLIADAAWRGRYRVEWRLPWRLRGYRIPQAVKARLEAEGFCAETVFSWLGNTAVGLNIMWGVD